jgi:Coenzyme PQQ synthesis protein D (PqqD)
MTALGSRVTSARSDGAPVTDERLTLRDDRLAWREAGEEIVALDRVTSEYLAVNASGMELWRALARGTTRAELAGLLRDRHGLTDEQAAGDVDRFVDELLANDLVTVG